MLSFRTLYIPQCGQCATAVTEPDFPGGRTDGNRYPVLGLGTGQAGDLAVPSGRDGLIACGPLLSDDGTTWLGTAC